jgi:hypothetical protein
MRTLFTNGGPRARLESRIRFTNHLLFVCAKALACVVDLLTDRFNLWTKIRREVALVYRGRINVETHCDDWNNRRLEAPLLFMRR